MLLNSVSSPKSNIPNDMLTFKYNLSYNYLNEKKRDMYNNLRNSLLEEFNYKYLYKYLQ